jgi:hypothetical protein
VRTIILVLSGLVAQGAGASEPSGSLAGYLPDTVEEACKQMNTADDAGCEIVPASEKVPYRIVIAIHNVEHQTAYTLAATTLGTISCKRTPTIITVGIDVNGDAFRSFDMWCSPTSPNIKLMRGWRTHKLSEKRQ